MKKIVLTIAMVTAAATLSAQRPVSPKPRSGEGGWTVPRTVDGQPDLQGTWANNNATPLERPVEFAGRATLTDAEVATLKARAARLFNGEGDAAFGDNLFAALLTNPDKFVSVDGRTGDYNQFWLPDRVFDNRTSLITDPPDGRIPALTPLAQRRAAAEAAAQAGDSAEARRIARSASAASRSACPRTQPAYMSYYQIVQSRDAVVFRMETIHDARVISTGRPSASRQDDSALARRLARPLGRRHARRRHDELLAEEQLPRVAREPASDRTLHARQPRSPRIRLHGVRRHDVDASVDAR